ncbi:hypothetical protein [Amycolatopsis sp. YIM 10]|uniref:hypothetical protein n=1 Tax=Amycolatopsis sp. YIM 10 TaxID=2653857 RepID=UPI00128FE4F0|nr:hypothetical protein [Amycolatopsis sp. YIM 10]QFU93966.1 hypothetical protein YIM_44160 [Amycolatopsis sp. YIM 10]
MTDQPPPPEPAPVRDQRRGLSVLLTLAALLLTVAGSFLPLFVSVLPGDDASDGVRMTVSGWTGESDTSGFPPLEAGSALAPFARNGAMLVVAALILAAAAALTARSIKTGSLAPARSASVAAAAFLLAIAGSIGMQATGWTDLFSAGGAPAGPGFGFWMVAAGAVLAIVAAILVNLEPQRAPRQDPPTDTAVHDVSTPRYGFPVPENPSPPAQP